MCHPFKMKMEKFSSVYSCFSNCPYFLSSLNFFSINNEVFFIMSIKRHNVVSKFIKTVPKVDRIARIC